MLSLVDAPIFERCLAAIGAGQAAEAELLLRDIDLSMAGPATRALHAKLWELAASLRGPSASLSGRFPVAGTDAFARPQISLVTSVFNRCWQLRQALPRNLETIRGAADIDLVVVNFGGDDSAEIQDLIEREFAFDLLTGQLKHFVIAVPWTRFDMARAKNIVHRLSQGEFVFSLDADNFFMPEDLAAVRDHVLHHRGSVLHQTTGSAPMRHSTWRRYAVLADAADYHDESPTWNGSSGRIGMSREAFERVNGYNETHVGMGMDDIDLLLRSMKAGIGYRHVRLDRPLDAVFIPNSLVDEARPHENNLQNWALMDEGINAKRFAPLGAPGPLPEQFSGHVPACRRHSATARVTLFCSAFGIQDYIKRFLVDLQAVTAAPGVCVWLLDVVGSHPSAVSEQLRAAADNPCVFYVPVQRDPGLYAVWNIAIRSIGSPYLGNLNADDLRGAGWLPSCLRVLESGLADVASPVTVPFDDKSASSYTQALSVLRAAQTGEVRWFESRCLVEGNYPHETTRHDRLVDGEYSQHDLFQLMDGVRLDSYCIPNASSVWSRRVHDLAGYFDEEKWGTFSDLALWAEAGARGARFRQVPYLSLFYISERQAHRRQTRNETHLVQLALRHAPPALRAWASRRQFDLSGTGGDFGAYHPLGWNAVRDQVAQHFLHTSPRLVLEMSVERRFLGTARPQEGAAEHILHQPWIGFVHGVPLPGVAFDKPVQSEAHCLDALLEAPLFMASLDACRGLVAHNQRDRAYLARRLAARRQAIPIYVLKRPAMPLAVPSRPCSLDLGTPIEPTVFHVGGLARSISLFAKLPIHPSRKVLLVPPELSVARFLQDVVENELGLHGLDCVAAHFGDVLAASPSDQVHLLKACVAFSHADASAGGSLVADCIDAGARLVINRHPAFVEQLGMDYPLFYDDEAEAGAKLTLALSPGFASMLQPHFEALRARQSIGTFCRELARIGEHVYESL